MKIRSGLLATAVSSLLLVSGHALANDLEGEIESVDAGQKTFVVQGITFHTSANTDYDDGLRRFEDLKQGQRVEVDFEYRDGKHHATEVELDD
jgi:hypothetical protein